MLNTLTFRSLGALLLLAFGLQTSISAQVTFWTETFSDQNSAEAGWINGGTNSGPSTWLWTDDPTAGYNLLPAFNAPTAGDGYFYFNSDANGDNDHDVFLTGPASPVSTLGKTNVHLKFYTQFAYYSTGSNASVGVSTDGVNFTYHPLFETLLPDVGIQDFVDVDLDEADNQPQVWLRFRWTGNFEYHWKIDDLELYEADAVNLVDITFKVNLTGQTISPMGVFIAGSFNNWSDQALTAQGNNVYSITLQLPADSIYQYKFKNGPGGWENVQPACGLDDNNGGFNRYIKVRKDDISLPAVCFNSCEACNVVCNLDPNAIICDDFESYNPAQKLGPQSDQWSTWTGTEGTTEDGIVSTEQSASPTKSLKIVSTATTGGPQDVVLQLGNQTEGRYRLRLKVFVPSGKNGYYNVQDVVPITDGDWNLDVFFENNGAGRIQIEQVDKFTFTYSNNNWVQVEHIFDLDNNVQSIMINGVMVGRLPYAGNLGGVDFFGLNNVSTFYVDDIEFAELPPVINLSDNCNTAYDITPFFDAGSNVAQVTGIFDNTLATTNANEPAPPSCFDDSPAGELNNSLFFTFTGDGNNYHVETVPCDATDYVDFGDTQMALFTGSDCSNLTEIDCNEDLDFGANNYASGLDISTTAGVEYTLLVDGYAFDGVAASGEFCLSIIRNVLCADAVAGTVDVANDGYVCYGTNVSTLLTLNDDFTLPTVGPVSGFLWVVTTQPVPPNTSPLTPGLGYAGSTSASPVPLLLNLASSAASAPDTLYITPIVFGGAEDTVQTNTTQRFHELDFSNGCFFTGASQRIILVDSLSALGTSNSVTNVTTPPGNNGAINLSVNGGSGDYQFLWSNNATTEDISGLAAGTYVVTISDATGCITDVTMNVVVGTVSAAVDPASVHVLNLSPNPASGIVTIDLQLLSASNVNIEVINSVGELVQRIAPVNTSNMKQFIDFSTYAEGVYTVRILIDGETALRRVVIQR